MNVLRPLALAIALLMCSVPVASGCDMFGELKEGLGHAQEVSGDIKSELGVDASVNFNITNGKKTVTVTLASTPSGDAAKIKSRVEAIVRKRFGAVDEIRITM